MNDRLKATEFHVYRYFLICNAQKTLFEKNKEEIEEYFFKIFKDNDKVKHRYNGKEYILYPIIDKDDLIVCKLSKEKNVTIHREGERDINTDKEIDYPYIFVVINIKRHMIIIQKNTSIFEDTLTSKNRLVDIINTFLIKYNYSIKIEAIVDREEFWAAIDKADKVYSLNLRLNAPNFFGARVEANEFMKKQREEYNLTTLEINMCNEEGNLNINQDNLDNFVEYAAEGGGAYKLEFNDGDTRRTINSNNKSKKILLPQELTKEDYDEVRSRMIMIDTLRNPYE